MKIILIYMIVFLLNESYSEIFTSIIQLEKLLKTEEEITNTLEKYIIETEKNLKHLKITLDELKNEHNKSSRNPEEYLTNPMNAFLLIKRLTLDWAEAQNIMVDTKLSGMIKNLTNNTEDLLIFPSEEDFKGGANAIIRIQEFYELNPSSMAKGELNGRQFNSQLSADDCFRIGKTAYDQNDTLNSILWMKEAMKLNEQEINKTIDKSTVLILLSRAYYNKKDIEKALNVVNELLKISPNNELFRTEKIKYEQELKETKDIKKEYEKNETSSSREYEEHHDPQFHKKLCRNEVDLQESVKAKLKCAYKDFGNPFLKLAKFKVEEIYSEPRILFYHDVLSDTEMETLKNLSIPTLSRAKVYWAGSNKTEFNHIRISQLSWLDSKIHSLLTTLNRRVEDMTGLNTKFAESLQVLNYGIGGFFDLHFDALKRENDFIDRPHQINRLATVLFYMSDVAQGGATVFPLLKVAIQPKKGTAAFWINLLPNGTTDLKTQHAACPILSGSKWISTKWIQEKGQQVQCQK